MAPMRGAGGVLGVYRVGRALHRVRDHAAAGRAENGVPGQEGDPFTLGLGEENSVERILVEGRKFTNCHRVRTGDRELFVTVEEEALA